MTVPADHPIAVEVNPDPAAILEAVGLFARRQPRWLRALQSVQRVMTVMGCYFVGATLGTVLARGADLSAEAFAMARFIGGFGLLSLVVLVPIPAARRAYRALLQTHVAKEPRRIELSSAGVRVDAPGFRLDTQWSAVDYVQRGKLGLSVGIAGSAWSLPRSAFSSDEDLEHTASMIETWRAAARTL